MDEALLRQVGGFSTRAELVREALENLLNELEYPDAGPEPASGLRRGVEVASGVTLEGSVSDVVDGPAVATTATAALAMILGNLPMWERDELALADIADTKLRVPSFRPALATGGFVGVAQEPMLGLHSRDYPSLWAAMRLARYSESSRPQFEEFIDRVTRAAWLFGSEVQKLTTNAAALKPTVLFPTNMGKQPSAERGFQSFAIGLLGRDRQNGISATGPLFAWRVLTVDASGAVGVTPNGWELLTGLAGVSLDMPHEIDHARRFLDYLARHAPADRWGFDRVLEVVATGPDRAGLVASFAEAHSEWTPAMASSIAQGYVARSREWGLVEPKLVEGRYWLTEFGRSFSRRLDQD